MLHYLKNGKFSNYHNLTTRILGIKNFDCNSCCQLLLIVKLLCNIKPRQRIEQYMAIWKPSNIFLYRTDNTYILISCPISYLVLLITILENNNPWKQPIGSSHNVSNIHTNPTYCQASQRSHIHTNTKSIQRRFH